MANYIFESITQAQAVGFTSADSLIFLTSSTTAASVTVSPATAPSGSAAPSGTDYGTVISDGTHTITFPSAAISGASTADHLLFNDGSHLIIGLNSSTADTLTSTSTATDTASTVIYGLGGNDTINLGAGPDYAYGGLGDDTIGSATANGNYHIYGNATGGSSTLPTGSTDVDTITTGSGSSYIQGNQGNDVIAVGTATSTGYNRIFGGADNDQITVNGGMGSHAAVNGNKGDDTITDASSGTNTLRGGQGNDTIVQTGASHDMIMGDMGSDILRVSGVQGHVAVLTGGSDGGDTFDFSQVGAGSVAHLDSTGANVTGTTSGGVTTYAAGTQTFYQEITDFQSSDHIQVQFSSAQLSTATIGHSNTVFASVSDAQTYAETQLTGNTLVSALTAVGADNMQHTYLFYHDAAGSTTADGVIQLDGVAASSVTVSAFQAAGTV